MIETGNVMLAFVLTLLAGLAMAVGSMISFIGKKTISFCFIRICKWSNDICCIC